jgi:TPR repeat protein
MRSNLQRLTLHLTLVLAASLLACGSARADQADLDAAFDAGLTAFHAGDLATAAAEWEPLAERGHAPAQFRMGVLYAAGEGVTRDLPKAASYYRQAAEQGHAEAQNALAFVYRVGNGVKQSFEESIKWYRLAAEAGVAEAQFNLGSLYAGGKGTERDFIEGYKWFSLAAAHDVKEARDALFYCADQMTPAQIAEAQRRAAAWRPGA